MSRRAPIAVFVVLMLSAFATPAFAQEKPPEQTSIEPMPPEPVATLDVSGVQLFAGGAEVKTARVDEQTTMRVTLANRGDKTANDVTVTLFAPGDGVRLTDASAAYGDIASGGGSATGDFGFVVSREGCYPEIGFGGTAKSSLGEAPFKFLVQASCPGPRLYAENVEYEGGDGDGVPEPGETLRVVVTLRNEGGDPATQVRGTMRVTEGSVTVVDGTAVWPDVASSSSAKPSQPFVVTIAADAKRSQGCEGTRVDDAPVSSDGNTTSGTIEPDGTVSSDGATTSGGGGSSGAGSVPGSGGTEPAPAPGGTDGTEPAPAPADSIAVAPPTNPPSADSPAEFAAAITVSASGVSFDVPIDTRVVCALADGGTGGSAFGKDLPASGTPRSAADAREVAATHRPASALPVAIVILIAVALVVVASRIGPAGFTH